MRISSVRIRNYRCLKDLELSLDDYTVLLGPNGTGKSALLYALDWFFKGGNLTTDDVYRPPGQAPRAEIRSAPGSQPVASDRVEVEVHFTHIGGADRTVLGMYARGDVARFRRSWSAEGGEKIIGNAHQGPGFAPVRAQTSAADKKDARGYVV